VVPRGKVVGGGSAVNGTIFERATPDDFADWVAQGNDEWSYEKVLPYFKKTERDLDIQNEWHGSDGPIPLKRYRGTEQVPTDVAFIEGCVKAGFPEDPDINAPTSIGAGALVMNNVDGYRMSTSHCYLEPVLGKRPNLTVQGDTFVRRVIFDGRKAVGVEADYNGQRVVYNADQIVLSSGAIKSAHLLLLSGIGPAADLKSFDIPVVFENRWVGKNFSDHCAAANIAYRVKNRVELDPLQHPGIHVGLHYTSEGSPWRSDMFVLATCNPHNVQILYGTNLFTRARMGINMMRKMSWRRVLEEARLGAEMMLSVAIMKHNSKGELTLASGDPNDQPNLQYHYLEDPQDFKRVRDGLRMMSTVLESEPYRKLGAERISPNNEELRSDEDLDNFIRNHVFSWFHMAATCRMGPDTDETAVVDQYGRVKGVTNLRICDTSIWPATLRRCTNGTAVMTGERVAGFFDN